MNGIESGISGRLGEASLPQNIIQLPKQKRGGKSLNITKRKGVYYFKMTWKGQRYFQTLDTPDRQIALARARGLALKVKGERWQELDGFKRQHEPATIGQVFEVFRPAAVVSGIKELTARNYCLALASIVRTVRGEIDVEGASTAILTEDLLADYERLVVKAAAGDPARLQRTRRSARSTVINGRAVFARWTKRIYKPLNLPATLQGFREMSIGRAETISYRLPAGELIARTLEEGRKLRTTRPELYLVFLLTYDLALRAGEAAECKWEWFAAPSQFREQRCVEILRRPDFAPKWNRERRVPVSEEVWGHLQGGRPGDGTIQERPAARAGASLPGYVLPGATARERRALVVVGFAGWMRSIGWERSVYPKCAHELRKLMGSRWYTELGAEVAQEWLGHKTMTTTCSYYAALTKTPKALEMD